jgi:hypothetical protein
MHESGPVYVYKHIDDQHLAGGDLMKAKMGIAILLVTCLMPCGAALGAGAAMNSSGDLILSHLAYNGSHFRMELDLYMNPSESGLFWKFRTAGPTTSQGQCGGTIDKSLNITDVCVLFVGGQYRIDLDYYVNPNDSQGHYWKLGAVEILQGTIQQITGSSFQ